MLMTNNKSEFLEVLDDSYQRNKCTILKIEEPSLPPSSKYRLVWIPGKSNVLNYNRRQHFNSGITTLKHRLSPSNLNACYTHTRTVDYSKKKNDVLIEPTECHKETETILQNNKLYTGVNITADNLSQEGNKNNSSSTQMNKDDFISENKPSIKFIDDINNLVKNDAETENALENKFNPISIEDTNLENNILCENKDRFEIIILNNQQLEMKYISF